MTLKKLKKDPPFFFAGFPGDLGGMGAIELDPDFEDRGSIALTVKVEFVGLTASPGKSGEAMESEVENGEEEGRVEEVEESVVETVLSESLLDRVDPLVL